VIPPRYPSARRRSRSSIARAAGSAASIAEMRAASGSACEPAGARRCRGAARRKVRGRWTVLRLIPSARAIAPLGQPFAAQQPRPRPSPPPGALPRGELLLPGGCDLVRGAQVPTGERCSALGRRRQIQPSCSRDRTASLGRSRCVPWWMDLGGPGWNLRLASGTACRW